MSYSFFKGLPKIKKSRRQFVPSRVLRHAAKGEVFITLPYSASTFIVYKHEQN